MQILQRRLEQVSPACAHVLQVGAVIGREVPFDVLLRVTGLPATQLLARLDEASAARLVVAVPGAVVTHRFAHALVQEALHQALPVAERVELHRAVAEALAVLRRGELDERAAELAHHFVQAVPGGDPLPAIRWSARAAHQALAATAYEEAVAHYGRALELAESVTAQEGLPRLGNLLLSLGDAQCRAGLTDACRSTFQRAADLALADGDPELLAYAVLGYGVGLGGFGFVEHADGVLLSLLEEALGTLDDGDSPLRMRLLARLATELYFTPFRSRRIQVSDEALAMARRLGDPAGELLALYSRTWALLGPDGVGERRATADHVVRLAHRLGDDEMAFRGHHLRLNVLLEVGEWEQAEGDVDSCRRLAATLAQPVHHWQIAVFDVMRVLLTGRADEAAALAEEALALGRRGYRDMAMVVYGAQLLTARWAQGRMGEVVEAVRSFADSYPHAPAWRAALAFCYAETGRLEAARGELEVLAAREFHDLPEDGNFLTAAALLAHVAAQLGDVERARLLRARLLPYADRYVVIAAGAVSFASVELPLGALATALGEPDAALRHLERAEQRHAARGARSLLVWTAEEKVRALLARAGAGDREEAAAVAENAIALARELGMPAHVERLLDAVPEAALAQAGAGRPVTLLLTDVAGSSALTERLGELAVHALLARHRREAERLGREFGGTALKSLGDGLLLAFPDAGAALRCARAVQAGAATDGLAVRLGVHSGPVLREGDSMYGRTMILAFRIADRARAGEVLVSAATRDAVRGAAEMRFDRGRRLRFKGFSEPQRVHRLLWQEAAMCPDQGSRAAAWTSASTASNAFRAAMSTGSHTGANGGA
jgi:class 3 adenylate cyclase